MGGYKCTTGTCLEVSYRVALILKTNCKKRSLKLFVLNLIVHKVSKVC